MIKDLLKYGADLETVGIIYGNGVEQRTIMFPNESHFPFQDVEFPTHEEFKELLYQCDTIGVEGLNKVILRKSQRQIENNVSWRVFHRDQYKCRYCNKGDGTPLTVDHIVLWEHMGASVEDNLISACKKCNNTRGNMLYQDWIKSAYYLKVMEGFKNARMILPDGNDGYVDSLNHARYQTAVIKNENAWEAASKLPLRATKRNR